jgi:Spy/CpxP family protein refolding chaperone
VRDKISVINVCRVGRVLGGTLLASSVLIISAAVPALARDINWNSLNLTPQQETQMERLEDNWEKTHHEVNAQIERDMAELKTLLPTGDSQRIRQLQGRIMTNKMYLMNESMDTFLKKRDMLTPVQRTQLQKIMPAKAN